MVENLNFVGCLMSTNVNVATVCRPNAKRVNECLALVATLDGAELDSYAAMVAHGSHSASVARAYAAVVGWTVRHCNAIATLVNAGILRGYADPRDTLTAHGIA